MKHSPCPPASVAATFDKICKGIAASELSDLELQRRTGVSAKTIKKLGSGDYVPKTIQGLIAVERELGLSVPPQSSEAA